MAEDREAFLSRWSRLKREQAAAPAPAHEKPQSPAPALPPVEKLTPESDFSGFMHPKVKEELRRVALKKLFGDPHFNIPDPFEPYSRDWNIAEAIPPEMLANLNQARTVLFREEEEKKAREQQDKPTAAAQAPDAAPNDESREAKQDEPGRKDA